MNQDILAVIIFLCILIWIVSLASGLFFCNKNNALGLIPLFIALNVIGLLIGFALLYNNKNKIKE